MFNPILYVYYYTKQEQAWSEPAFPLMWLRYAFHKKFTTPHECSGMLDLEGLDFSLLCYVRWEPYPEEDVMPAQVWALLFGQSLSLLINIIGSKTRLML